MLQEHLSNEETKPTELVSPAGSDQTPPPQITAAKSRKPAKATSKGRKKAPQRKTGGRSRKSGSHTESANDPRELTDTGTASPFLELPPELRNEIYRHVIVVGHDEDLHEDEDYVEIAIHRPYVTEPALLAVNRQIRSETVSIFYGENIFRIKGSVIIVHFLRTADEDVVRSLRYVQIKTGELQKRNAAMGRIRQLLREFKSRGLRKSAIHYEAEVEGETEWVNLKELEELG